MPKGQPVVLLVPRDSRAHHTLRLEHLALLVEAGARAPSPLVVAVLGPG